jgi:hypothetical protein
MPMKLPNRPLLHAAFLLAFVLSSPAFGGGSATDASLEPAGDSMRLDSTPEWVLRRDEEGIRSYEKKQEGTPLLSFKAEGEIDAPIDLVLSILLDAERADEWISHLSESVLVRWIEAPREFVQLSRFDIPWPVKDRVFVSRIALEVDPETFEAVIVYLPADDLVEPRDAILGSATGSRFVLRPIDGGRRTDFVGIGVADPKGAIPSWIVNWAGGSWPHQTIEALRKQVRKSDVVVTPPIASLYQGFTIEPRLSLISTEAPPAE